VMKARPLASIIASWTPPRADLQKVNFCGDVVVEGQFVRVGVAIRGNNGVFVAGMDKKCESSEMGMGVEAIANEGSLAVCSSSRIVVGRLGM
ncbi:unnamed protein product, partial [Ilex paraguariensis]